MSMRRVSWVWTVAALAAGMCSAATYTWTGESGDGKFSTAANWGVDHVAFTVDDTCVFASDSALLVTLDVPVTVGTVIFSGGGAVTISGGSTLTVTSLASGADAGEPTFECPVVFSGGYLVNFATTPANFAGGATATFPDAATTDNEASHTLIGEIHFTEDWTAGKYAYSYKVIAGSKVYGKLFTGNSTEGTSGTNGSGIALVIQEDGYAEFDKVIAANKACRVAVKGRLKVNGIYQVGTEGLKENSHVGFDGDETGTGVIEAGGVLKYSNYNCYAKVPTFYIGAQGLGAMVQDYTLHFDGCDKMIYATDNFEIVGPENTGNRVDWGLTLDKTVTFDTQGYTITWTGGANGGGKLIKAGEGTLVMKPWGNGLSGGIQIDGGTLKIANAAGAGSSAMTLASGTTLEIDNPAKSTLANAVTAADGVTLAFNLSEGLIQGHLGLLTPPSSGTVAVKVTGAPSAVGTVYPLTSGAALAQTDLARFALTGRDDMTLGLSDAGDLILTVTVSDFVTKTFTYAAENAGEAIWSTDVAAWTLAGDVAKTAFEMSCDAIFAGTIASSAATVSVPEDLLIGNVTIATPSDLTFVGSGRLGGIGTITKSGNGLLTLDGANFEAQNWAITAGKVVLGLNAGVDSFGADSGANGSKVSIGPGAQFNLNYIGENTEAGNNSSARAEITQHKTFVIEGDGPDGRGAIVNDAQDGRETHNAAWNAAFRRIELAGDASIGGIDRFDVRARAGTAATAAGGIYGTGKKLTVRNTGYFGLVSLPIDVESVLITDGGVFRPESATITIPGGITLDGGTLHAYSTTYPATTPIWVRGGGGAISGQSGTSTFNAPVDIAPDARLTLEGGAVQVYAGGVTNNAEVSATAGSHAFTGGDLVGSGDWKVAGGSLFWGGGLHLGGPRSVDVSSGTFYYGWDQTEMGKLDSKVTVNMTGGSVGFALGVSDTVTADDLTVNGDMNTLRMRSRNDRSVVGRLEGLNLNVVSDGFRVGVDGYPANYVLGEGTTISADNLWIGNSPDSPYSILTVDDGATLSVKNTFCIGDREGNGTKYDYRLVVDGGKVVQTGTTRLRLGYKSNASYVDFRSGEMDLYGIQCQNAWMEPNTYVEKFTMDGGTLTIGTGGICAWTHFEPFVQLNNGTVNCSTDWVVEQLRSVSFGDRAGGHVTFDLSGKSIDWRTGIIGAADVTITGPGSFTTGVGVKDYMRFQGAATGAWTIENTGVNDLSGASGFLGGLHLAEGVSANLRIGGSNLVSAVYLQTGSGQFETACTWSNAYPFACNDLTLLHAKGVETDYSNAVIMWQGQFYADTAGTWTFGGGYDDAIRIDVDGEKVMEHATWNTVNSGTVNLSVGWHDFRIVQYQAGGGWGTVPSGWANVMNVGFAKRSVDGTDAQNFARFDADNIPLRSGPVTGAGGTVNWHVVHEKTDWNTRTDWTFEGVTNQLSMLDIYNVALPETIGNSVHMFDGWVFVPVTKSGDWNVYMDFDDRASLKIDGVDSGATGDNNDAGHNGAIAGVTPGWHRFELRVCDTGGNWGPWNGTTGQAKNPTAKITVNGVTYKFDETVFRFSHLKPVEYAGLDGEVRIDEGATLSNTAATACPIWGALAGTGTLYGPFAFAGESNVWKVTGSGNVRALDCVQFENAAPEMLAGLCGIEAVFAAKPASAIYELGPAFGADPEKIALSVQDEEGNDYSGDFSVFVSDGMLLLRNAKPAGTVVIFH
ncbi:MAG: hypothetical protein J6336_02680 [Kiritimatiellae bacterium]|nr:hypothetical protein [Kiritimatiellia bacterium]